MKALAAALLLPALGIGSAVVLDPIPVEITEWKVPWERTRPRDPFVDPQGKVWFVGQVGNYVGQLDPQSGRFQRFELPAGALPHNVIVARDGSVWYAGNGDSHIGRIDPKTGKVVARYDMPDAAARDPHTLLESRDGAHIWFTVQGGNFVGRLTKAGGRVELVKIPTAGARPYGITLDSQGRPWFNQFGTSKIAMVDPETMALREFPLPEPGARGRRIAITSDDVVWYVDYARGALGRLDPKTGAVKEFSAPSGQRSRPYAMAVDDRDRLWYVETGVQPNQLVGFDPKESEVFSLTPIQESGAGTVRHMVFHQPTRSLWFGTDANTLGRARVP